MDEGTFKIYLDYGGSALNPDKQLFKVALNGADDAKRWQIANKDVAIVVELGDFKTANYRQGRFHCRTRSKTSIQ